MGFKLHTNDKPMQTKGEQGVFATVLLPPCSYSTPWAPSLMETKKKKKKKTNQVIETQQNSSWFYQGKETAL